MGKLQQEDLTGAIKDFDEAERLDPQYVPTITNRGIAKAKNGDHEEALKDCRLGLAMEPPTLEDKPYKWQQALGSRAKLVPGPFRYSPGARTTQPLHVIGDDGANHTG